MSNVPVPSNITFTRSGDSVFENVTIYEDLNVQQLDVYGKSSFADDAKFEKDVTIEGDLELSSITAKISLDVGAGGTVFSADTRTDRVGIFTATPQQKLQFNSEEENTLVITDQGIVGIGTVNPGAGITARNDATQGKLSLDIETLSVRRNIYDSAGSFGVNGAFLNRDEFGVRWVTFEPSFSEGVFIQDEGVFIPQVGAAQSFTVLNFTQINSLGVGTDSLIPIPDPSNPIEVARIQTKDFWGANGDGDIYRLTNVGIGKSLPSRKLDVVGGTHLAGILTVTGNVFFDNALDVDGGTTLNDTLDVDGITTLNSELDVDGATTLNSSLDVDGATTLNNTLDVDGDTTFNSTQESTNTTSGSVQVDGGVGIVKRLNVGGDVNFSSTLNVDDIASFNSTQESTNITSGSVQVDGGVGIAKRLNVGGAVDFDNNLNVDGTSVFQNTIELNNSLIDINDQTGVNGKDYRLASVGTGVSWRPSGVETQNTIWVSKDGDDSNSGFLEGDAKATIGGAAAVALPGDTIKIRPGRYIENNPVGLRRDVSITGEDLRLVTVEPQNLTSDVFWLRRGCLVENLNFSGATVGVAHTGAGAVAFPITGVNAASGYTQVGPATEGPTFRWRSPYVRNCTNFMTKSIGMRINGDDATASVDGANLKSMVCDSFTQYNEAGVGVSLTNNAYAQLVSIFTINCDIAIFAGSGAQCDLTNSNSSFGNFGLVAVGLGSTQFTGKVLNDVIPGTNSDVVTGIGISDSEGDFRRPFDGQAAYFKINLDNYPDADGSGRITAPLQELASIKILNGGTPGQFTPTNPPDILIRDNDGTVTPKGPQGIVAEASANVSAAGTITSIDVINSGRNYLPTQNIVVDIDGNPALSGFATAVMEPIYFTVSESTDNRQEPTGISTITFNEFVPYELFADDPFTLQRISRILTSSHSFEYVGSGTSINTSLPFEGALSIKENEIVFTDGAQIPFTSTDQKGNFDIGEGIQIDQTTSTIRGRDFSKAIQAEVTPLILALR